MRGGTSGGHGIFANVSAITIDSDQWPICFIKIDGAMTPGDFERYISVFNALYERNTRFSVITWVKTFSPNADIGKRVGVWFKETEPQIKKYWVSNAMVSDSAAFRFILSAVYLVKPFPAKSKVCAHSDEAIAFTRASWKEAPPKITWPY